MSQKAQIAKDKGNAAFKTADYPTAIGHYTTAILADKNDPTYPLNRAAAYLKLGKYEDAERDCTTVLGLSKNNVKALFRRGQARVALGKQLDARKDFSEVLVVEPSNGAAQDEMKKLTILIQQDKAKKKPQTPASFVQSSLERAAATARRRVPIKIIDSSGKVATAQQPSTFVPEPEQIRLSDAKQSPPSLTSSSALDVKSPSSSDVLQPISSRSLKKPSVVSPTVNVPTRTEDGIGSKPNSFSEAKAARESARPSLLGGGISRASGESTIFGTGGDGDKNREDLLHSTSAQLPVSMEESKAQVFKEAPNTLFDFNRTWNSLSSEEERWRYINTIEPPLLPTLCKTSLEPSLFVSIIETFLAVLSTTNDGSDTKRRVLAYMESFGNVPRFGTVVLFLSKKEKQLAKQVWGLLGVEKPSSVWRPLF